MSSNFFQQYAIKLLQLVTNGNFDTETQFISLAGTTLVVDLGNANSKIINKEVFDIGNAIPTWSTRYSSNNSLLTSYTLFLYSIDLDGDPDPQLDSEIEKAYNSLMDSQSKFNDIDTQAREKYNTYKNQASENITFGDYINQFYPAYSIAKDSLNAKIIQYEDLMKQKYGDGYSVIAEARKAVSPTGGAADITDKNSYNMPIITGSLASAGGTTTLPGQTPPPPDSTLVESYAPAFSIDGFTTKYQEWQAASADDKKAGYTITIKKSNSVIDSEPYFNEIPFDFSTFPNFLNFSNSDSDDNWWDEQFELTISFIGLATFSISPGVWFDKSIVSNYCHKLKSDYPSFFGKNGSMSLLPTEIIVGFQPQIKLRLNNKAYQSAKNSLNSQKLITIGSFNIGSSQCSTYGSKSDILYEDSGNTITIGPVKSTLPLLLGVTSTKLGLLSPKPPISKSVQFGDQFYLRNQNGQYIVGADKSLGLNGSQYYPRLGNTGKIALEFTGGIGNVENGMIVQIKTTEEFVGKYNVLGAWTTPSCYYYSTETNYQQQNWQIFKNNPNDKLIQDGDQVYFKNIYYKDQNLVSNGLYLTTKKDVDEFWIIEKVEDQDS